MRQRALDTRKGAVITLAPLVVQPVVRETAVKPETAAQLSGVPVGIPDNRQSQLFGLHYVSLGLLAGMAAIIGIVLLPDKPAQNIVAPAAHAQGTAATPVLAKPSAQTPLAKAVTAPAKPTDRLIISGINLDASVTQVGLTKEGALDAPKTLWQVAHYSKSPQPGDKGTSIIDGHSGEPGQYGVLESLGNVKVGQTVVYKYVNGHSVTFKVTSSAAYPEVQATAERLFKPTSGPSLNIISCYGNWNSKTQDYDRRWIVTAVMN
jgi:hypothetical protein